MSLQRFEPLYESVTEMMAEEEWGPTRTQYMDTFEDRIEASFSQYLQCKEITIQTSNDLIPVSLLETTLAVGENMNKVGFQSGAQIFSVLMSTIKGYVKLHPSDMFEHYYGFLCVRHIIRMVSIGILRRHGSLETFLGEIQRDCPWNRVTARLSEASHDIIHTSLASNDQVNTLLLLGFSHVTWSAFADDGGLTMNDVGFLIEALWESRKSILPLRFKGLLPGFPVFLFLLYNLTQYNDMKEIERPWLKVQDLVQRCYLGDSNTYERNVLRQVSRWIHDKVSGKYDFVLQLDYVPVDDDDAHAVVQAYSNLLAPPIPLSLAPIMLLDVSMTMYRWISYMLKNPQPRRPALDKLAPIAAKAALERLWLEIDRERDGPMANNRRSFTRTYAMDALNNISTHYLEISDPQIRDDIPRMLLDMEIYSLLGRVLALVTYESESDLEFWDLFINKLREFSDVLDHLMNVPEAQPESIISEWDKVALLLAYRLDSSIRCPTPKYILDDAMETWNILFTRQLAEATRVYVCSNPRCADPFAISPPPEAKATCGACKKALYCSRRCQRIHWMLTAQAHALECR
ncbi:unnamed protein product [Rhizoctonia solani]|uniref:MYND-type domain-containing protein n=1 Tax=Rhizoctonia solani TaxID=456999 RepID=A0A8H3DUM5_9AGAM|nr:unnamed protein product [Rhizoctonia solani]